MITDRRNFTTKKAFYGISSFHFTVRINSNSFHWPVNSVHGTYSQILFDVGRPFTTRHDGLSGRGLMTSSGHARPFNKITRNWVNV